MVRRKQTKRIAAVVGGRLCRYRESARSVRGHRRGGLAKGDMRHRKGGVEVARWRGRREGAGLTQSGLLARSPERRRRVCALQVVGSLRAPHDGLHHSLPRARGRLSAAPELGPMPVGHGEKPGSAATRFGASWRAPRTASVSGPCVTGRNPARLLRRRRKSSDAEKKPPGEGLGRCEGI